MSTPPATSWPTCHKTAAVNTDSNRPKGRREGCVFVCRAPLPPAFVHVLRHASGGLTPAASAIVVAAPGPQVRLVNKLTIAQPALRVFHDKVSVHSEPPAHGTRGNARSRRHATRSHGRTRSRSRSRSAPLQRRRASFCRVRPMRARQAGTSRRC